MAVLSDPWARPWGGGAVDALECSAGVPPVIEYRADGRARWSKEKAPRANDARPTWARECGPRVRFARGMMLSNSCAGCGFRAIPDERGRSSPPGMGRLGEPSDSCGEAATFAAETPLCG